MSNPDNRVHASEACMTIVCCLVLLAAIIGCVLAIADAYQP